MRNIAIGTSIMLRLLTAESQAANSHKSMPQQSQNSHITDVATVRPRIQTCIKAID
jgi:hypothetical protein